MNILLLVWIREGRHALVHGLDSRTIHLLLSSESLMCRSCVRIEDAWASHSKEANMEIVSVTNSLTGMEVVCHHQPWRLVDRSAVPARDGQWSRPPKARGRLKGFRGRGHFLSGLRGRLRISEGVKGLKRYGKERRHCCALRSSSLIQLLLYKGI